MSNHLAVATVTAALGQRVFTAISEVGINVDLEFGRPNGSETIASHKVHVHLYQITPNAARRNDDRPTRDSAGKLTGLPRAALDLHYLIAFYGDAKVFEPEQMLGAVVRDLHTNPILTGQDIRAVLGNSSSLVDSDLADAVDRIRFTPAMVSLDELSKLWSVFFQTPYALSVAYTASVVLIDAVHGGARAAPVLRRGEGDRGPQAQANAIPPFPILEGLHIGEPSQLDFAALPRFYPAAVVGNMLILRGMNLAGHAVELHFRHLRFTDSAHPQHWQLEPITIPPEQRTDTEIRFTLPHTVAWRVGTYALSIRINKDGKWHKTNEMTFQLSPRVSAVSPAMAAGAAGSNLTVTITCQPVILIGQTVELILAEASKDTLASSWSTVIEPDKPPSSLLVFNLENVPVTHQSLVRIRVDGVESVPYAWQGNPPSLTISPNQTVTITASGADNG